MTEQIDAVNNQQPQAAASQPENNKGLQPRQVVVQLGGKPYTITPLTLGKSQAWRKEFSEPFDEIVTALQHAPDVDLTDLAAVGNLAAVLKTVLLQGMDIFFTMLCKYSPEIAADTDRILDTATDEEVMLAMVEVLKLAYPFGRLAGALMG